MKGINSTDYILQWNFNYTCKNKKGLKIIGELCGSIQDIYTVILQRRSQTEDDVIILTIVNIKANTTWSE